MILGNVLRSACLIGLMLVMAVPAQGAGTDVDFDGILRYMDETMESMAVAKGIPLSEVIFLSQQDQDENGILDDDQFAMLSAVLMGTYTLDGTSYGTNQLNSTAVQRIQQGFSANKTQIQSDMVVNNWQCWWWGLDSCNVITLITARNSAMGAIIADLLAGYFTLGETGFTTWNGTTDDFVEQYVNNVLYILFTGTNLASHITDIQGDITFSPNSYYKFGSAANTRPSGITQVNYLGSAGDIDGNISGGRSNGAEYAVAGANRERWLTACHITPPLRITEYSPASVTALSSESFTWTVGFVGGTQALGRDPAQVQWEKYKTSTIVVQALSPELSYTDPYFTTSEGGYRYSARVMDEIWTRVSPGSWLTVLLDSGFRIVEQPVGGEFNKGDSHTLSVVVAGGDAEPTYQWYKGGVEISGATKPELHFESLTTAQAGIYRCKIYGDTGLKAPSTLTTNPAKIVVYSTEEGEIEGEGAPLEGELEGEGSEEGAVEGQPEGAVEGQPEGAVEGQPEGIVEGQPEGVVEGQPEGIVEGQPEGVVEGQPEGVAEGQIEGVAEGQPEGVAEGQIEGSEEGQIEGSEEGQIEGSEEGQPEGIVEGQIEGVAEGQIEGVAEGQPEGFEEGQPEGVVEGEGEEALGVTLRIGFSFSRYSTVPVELLATNNPPAFLAFDLYFDSKKFSLLTVEKGPSLTSAGKTLEAVSIAPGCKRITISDTEQKLLPTIPPGVLMYLRFDVVDHCFIIGTELSGKNGEAQDALGRPMDVEVTSGFITDEVPCTVEGEGVSEGGYEGSDEGEGMGEGPWHSADTNFNNRISLSELLRVIQFFNVDSYHCQAGTEDGFAPGPGGTDCAPHASDYIPQNWMINLYELLRLIQFLNSNGYHACENSEDGFCPGLW